MQKTEVHSPAELHGVHKPNTAELLIPDTLQHLRQQAVLSHRSSKIKNVLIELTDTQNPVRIGVPDGSNKPTSLVSNDEVMQWEQRTRAQRLK